MKANRRIRGRVPILIVGVGLAGCALAAVVLADSAGAAPLPRAVGGTAVHAVRTMPTAVGRSLPSATQGPATRAAKPASASGAGRSGPTAPPSMSRPAATAAAPEAAQGLPLTAAQLPDADGEIWQPTGTPVTRSVAGHDIGINECASVIGAQTWSQQGYTSAATQDPAIQDAYTFASPGAARTAYSALVDAMKSCGQASTALQRESGITPDAEVSATAAQADASAWERAWTGVQGMSAAGLQVDHYYFALRGAAVLSLQFTELTSPAKATYPVAADESVLTMLETERETQ